MSGERKIAWIAAGTALLVHLLGNPHYAFFRDELYFIICGRHPDWGYVDQPPVVPLLAAMTQVLGHSLFLLRAIPALFAAASIFVTCALVVEFGGGTFAQILASLVFLFAGVLTSFGMKVGTDEVGLWTWPLIALLVVRIAKGADRRLWLVAGAAAGITFESKYSVVFFLAAMFAGMLASSTRRILSNRWFALGCAVALVIALPNVLWQWQHGLPMLELLRNGQNGRNLVAGPLLYLAQQALITTVFLAPVWIVGVVWFFCTPQYRFLGIAYVTLIVAVILLHGKHYYPANVYPIAIAAGAVPVEAWTRNLRFVRAAIVAYATIVGIAFLPLSLPVLPEATYVAYAGRISAIMHVSQGLLATEHSREDSALPGDWADMHGWPELAAAVQGVYDSLPPNERAQAVVLGDNYGGASAVAFFTPTVPVISVHNQYWLWGLQGHSGNVLVQIGGSCFRSERLYASRTVVTTFSSRWGIDEEQNVPIAICRGPRTPLAAEWPHAKAYI